MTGPAKTAPGAVEDDRADVPEHELKLVLPAPSAGAVHAWLAARCRPDPRYPDGIVSSVYYDADGLPLLYEKIDSDFVKTKVRLRWYRDPVDGTAGPAFLEVKRKVGARRFKRRKALAVPARRLEREPLASPAWRQWAGDLPELEPLPGHDLRPVVEIRFRRHRWIEPTTGDRVALDTGIHAVRGHPGRLPTPPPVPLRWAVVEVKGPRRHPGSVLAPLVAMGARKASFSKYHSCLAPATARLPA